MPCEQPKKRRIKRRAFHDYSQPGIYMVTLVIDQRRPLFATLVTDPAPAIQLTPLGIAAAKIIDKTSNFHPNVKILKCKILPDHIHILLEVTAPFPPRKDERKGDLGFLVNGIKVACRRACTMRGGKVSFPLFEKGYYDRLIIDKGHIEDWKRYLDGNLRRLIIKRDHPDYFTTLREINLGIERCTIVGNIFLLDNPDKMAVIVHRKDSPKEYAQHKKEWFACGERGGVLVSASVSKKEQEVMTEAMLRGYKIIHIRENGFPLNYKPGGRSLAACASGQLLQVAPCSFHFDRKNMTRDQCLALNSVVNTIVSGQY